MILAVDAAHWWGPLGWLYRNTTGNIAASAIWGPVGLVVGMAWEKRKVIGPIHRRLDEHHASLQDLHSKQDRLHSHLGVPTERRTHGQRKHDDTIRASKT